MEDFLYLTAKFIAYSAWCYFGFRFFRTPGRDDTIKSALRLGIVRFCLGIFFGFVILMLVQLLFAGTENSFDSRALAYVLVFIPARFAEWLIMTCLIQKTEPHPSALWWILGGVFLSCLTDIPGGLRVVPLGKIWC
jgi:preprotein translocase subunit Sss1